MTIAIGLSLAAAVIVISGASWMRKRRGRDD